MGTGVRCTHSRCAPGDGPSPLLDGASVCPFRPPRWADGRRGSPPSPGEAQGRKGRVPRPCCFKCWERGALGAPGRRAPRASAWVGCAPGVPEHDQRGRGGKPQTSPHPFLRLGITGRLKYASLPWGFGVRRARDLGGRGAAVGPSLFSAARRLYFSAPRRAPAPRARGWYFSTRLAGAESAALRRPAASRDPAGRALRVLTRRLYLRRQAGRRAGAAPRRTKADQRSSKPLTAPGAQHEESRGGKIQYFPG